MTTTWLRISRIAIDLPRHNTEAWVQYDIQAMPLDPQGNPTQLIDFWHRGNKRIAAVTTETAEVDDPVTGQHLTASVAGLQLLIRTFLHRWICAETGAADTDGRLTLEQP